MSQLWRGSGQPDYARHPTNGFISNFQIPVSSKASHPKRYYWKEQAIKYAAATLGQLIPEQWRMSSTFVPVPPSKIKDHPDHDPRLMQALHAIRPKLADIRELVLQRENVDSKQKGVCPSERAGNYYINQTVAETAPDVIFIFDDVLTTGCHFKAMEILLKETFKETAVYGLFLARAVRPPQDDDVDLVQLL